MSDCTVKKVKIPSKYDVAMAEKELIAQLAEAEKYTNEQCSDFNMFSEQLKAKLHEKI